MKRRRPPLKPKYRYFSITDVPFDEEAEFHEISPDVVLAARYSDPISKGSDRGFYTIRSAFATYDTARNRRMQTCGETPLPQDPLLSLTYGVSFSTNSMRWEAFVGRWARFEIPSESLDSALAERDRRNHLGILPSH